MKISINSNQSSLMTLRYLDRTNADLRRSFERLSSGLRINRAVDDAAGLAISEEGRAQSRVLGQASRNISDGVSLFNIADGASSQIGNLLTRMAELAEQAGNGSITKIQRKALHAEYVELDREIRRISETTEFNGIKIFEGEASTDLGTLRDSGFAAYNILDVQGDGEFAVISTFGKTSRMNLETGEITQIAGSTATATYGAISQLGDVIVRNEGTVGRRDLVYYDAELNRTHTLTDSGSSNDAGHVAFSDDGSTVVFTSFSTYADGQNIADGRTGVSGTEGLYKLDLTTNKIQVLQSSTLVSELDISADGSYLAARSNSTLGGENPEGNVELFVAALTDGPLTDFNQITHTTSGVGTTQIYGVSTDGNVLFSSRQDLTGQNPATNGQAFLASFDGQISQITSFVSGDSASFAGVSSDLDSIYFLSDVNPTGDNGNSFEQVFRVNSNDGSMTQLTRFDGSQTITDLRVSGDGRRATFVDNASQRAFSLDLRATDRNYEIEAGYGETAKNVVTGLGSMTSSLEGLGGMVLTSQEAALDTLDQVKENIQFLADLRGTIGAGLSRLNSAHAVTKTQQLELQRAVSQIRDVDVATESATLARNSILQQAQATVLAQANQQPALALQLLGGL